MLPLIESVPDGSLWIPHHYIYPLYTIVILLAWKWDDFPKKEPLIAAVGLATALTGWFHFWTYLPWLGVTLCGIGLGFIVYGAYRADQYSRRWRIAVASLALFAADDWLSHGFGVWTPLDWLFNEYIYHLLF